MTAAPAKSCDGALQERSTSGQKPFQELVDAVLAKAARRCGRGAHDQVAVAVGLDPFEGVLPPGVIDDALPHLAIKGVLLSKGSLGGNGYAHDQAALKR